MNHLILFLITSFMFKNVLKLFVKDNLGLLLKLHISSTNLLPIYIFK